MSWCICLGAHNHIISCASLILDNINCFVSNDKENLHLWYSHILPTPTSATAVDEYQQCGGHLNTKRPCYHYRTSLYKVREPYTLKDSLYNETGACLRCITQHTCCYNISYILQILSRNMNLPYRLYSSSKRSTRFKKQSVILFLNHDQGLEGFLQLTTDRSEEQNENIEPCFWMEVNFD